MMQFSEPSGYDLILSVVLFATLTKVKRQSFPYPFASSLTAGNLLFVPIWTELLEIGPEIASFFFVLDAGENHLGVWNLGARILDVFLERCLIPGDAGALVRIAVIESIHHAGL